MAGVGGAACRVEPEMHALSSKPLFVAVALALASIAACASDTSSPADPAKLDPPPAGKGFQLETEEIFVPPATEEQDCYFFKMSELLAAAGLPPDKPFLLHRIQTAQREGSHHMNIFRVRTIVKLDPANGRLQKGTNGAGECFKSPNWADWPLVANTQIDGTLDWTYPDGVANMIQPDEWLMLQTHFVNATTQATPTGYGKVRTNFWSIPQADVKHEMGTLFATKQSIRICKSNPKPEFSGTCQFGAKGGTEPIHIIGANGHFHSRGSVFDMYAWDGVTTTKPAASALFYESKSWDDPLMKISPDLDLTVPPKSGVFYTCAYEWSEPEPAVGCKGLDDFDKSKYGTADTALDCCYTFGPIVEKNEHCNIFVYYYPKTDDIVCF